MMSADFFYDGDDGLAYDDDWLYVDDDYPLADELAETSVPDPGYAGTNYEILLEDYFYDDIYEFWDDLEYGQDVYWDCQVKRRTTPAGALNSRLAEQHHGKPQKRRKSSKPSAHGKQKTPNLYPPVLFLTHKEREDRIRGDVKEVQNNKSTAFLADWRTRYAREEPSIVNTMPADMRKAAETLNNDGDTLDGHSLDTNLERSGESRDDIEALDDAHGRNVGPGDLDAETLQTILSSKLKDAGLDGADSSVFLQSLTQMLGGEGDMDDVAGNLAKVLLEDSSGSNKGAMMGWLSRQGVRLDEHTDDEAEAMEIASALDGESEEQASNGPLPDIDDGGSAQTGASTRVTKGSRKRPAEVEETSNEQTSSRSRRKRHR